MSQVQHTRAKRGSPAENDVGVQTFPQVHIYAIDRVNHNLVNARVFQADDLWVEKDLWCAESLGSQLTTAQVNSTRRCTF
jgi:hypothetical protein